MVTFLCNHGVFSCKKGSLVQGHFNEMLRTKSATPIRSSISPMDLIVLGFLRSL